MRALIALITIFTSYTLYAESIELIVKTPFLTSPGDTIYITGNTSTLCHWKVDCLALTHLERNIWKADFDIPNGANVEFKITRGNWESEAADQHGNKLSNMIISSNKQIQKIIVTIPSWKDLAPFGSKNVYLIKSFPAPEIKSKKNIFISLPESYRTNSKIHYPVIYAHDGQNLFSGSTAAFGNEWGLDEVLSFLNENNMAQEAIVVGISSDANRTDEYHYYRKGKDYARFIVETLKPFIDNNFRTRTGRESTFMLGSSMGALISVTMLWQYPNIFSKVAAISFPAFAYDNYMFKFLDEFGAPPSDVMLYLDHGGQGQDAQYAVPVGEWIAKAKQLGLPEENIHYQVFPFDDHNEIDWCSRVHIPIKLLLER